MSRDAPRRPAKRLDVTCGGQKRAVAAATAQATRQVVGANAAVGARDVKRVVRFAPARGGAQPAALVDGDALERVDVDAAPGDAAAERGAHSRRRRRSGLGPVEITTLDELASVALAGNIVDRRGMRRRDVRAVRRQHASGARATLQVREHAAPVRIRSSRAIGRLEKRTPAHPGAAHTPRRVERLHERGAERGSVRRVSRDAEGGDGAERAAAARRRRRRRGEKREPSSIFRR